jgi:antitoxin (DNA-binding transcriptional repressor) of toxin-antitoxin stability system
MTTITVEQIQQNPEAFLRLIQTGESLILTRDNEPVAEVTPIKRPASGRRPIGLAKGQIVIADDFDAPLPEEILREFEGR